MSKQYKKIVLDDSNCDLSLVQKFEDTVNSNSILKKSSLVSVTSNANNSYVLKLQINTVEKATGPIIEGNYRDYCVNGMMYNWNDQAFYLGASPLPLSYVPLLNGKAMLEECLREVTGSSDISITKAKQPLDAFYQRMKLGKVDSKGFSKLVGFCYSNPIEWAVLGKCKDSSSLNITDAKVKEVLSTMMKAQITMISVYTKMMSSIKNLPMELVAESALASSASSNLEDLRMQGYLNKVASEGWTRDLSTNPLFSPVARNLVYKEFNADGTINKSFNRNYTKAIDTMNIIEIGSVDNTKSLLPTILPGYNNNISDGDIYDTLTGLNSYSDIKAPRKGTMQKAVGILAQDLPDVNDIVDKLDDIDSDTDKSLANLELVTISNRVLRTLGSILRGCYGGAI